MKKKRGEKGLKEKMRRRGTKEVLEKEIKEEENDNKNCKERKR